jgi:MFS family permease
MVGLAALAMVGTLPGRTQGLGLVTEALLRDLQLDRVAFARMNLWATLAGALFALGTGRLLDQWGPRRMLVIVAAGLGAVVLAMSGTAGAGWLLGWLVLTRGLGQNALSVISLTMVGQWFARRLSLAMAVYAVALSVGFMMAFPVVGHVVGAYGWRVAWAGIGGALLLGLVPLAAWLARPAPSAAELAEAGEAGGATTGEEAGRSLTWGEALRTPAFWVFALGSATYNLIASGLGLFNESILAERGFAAGAYHRSLVITALTSLLGNFLGGRLAASLRLGRLLAVALGLLAVALAGVPLLRTQAQLDALSVVMGVAGGLVIVLFFTVWPKAYGRGHLGRIQGTAQSLTVLASAVGPWVLAQCQALTGSYAAVFQVVAAVVVVQAVAAWCVQLPARGEEAGGGGATG